MADQYQNLSPNRGIYANMKFQLVGFIEYPKWIDIINGEGKSERVLVNNAAEERTLTLRSGANEASGSAPNSGETLAIVRERNELAGKVTELSQALAEAKAQPEALLKEMAEMRQQMNEMSKLLLAKTMEPAKAVPQATKTPSTKLPEQGS